MARVMYGISQGYLENRDGQLVPTSKTPQHFLWVMNNERFTEPSCSSTFLSKLGNVIAIEYFRSWRPEHEPFSDSSAYRIGDYFAFVRLPWEDVRVVKLGDAERIDGAVMKYRKAICESGNVKDSATNSSRGLSFGRSGSLKDEVQRLGVELRRMLLDPVLPDDPGRLKQLTIAPDGALGLLPFESLPLDDGTFVDDRFAINYVNSLWQATYFYRWKDTTPKAIRIVGDPDYEAPCPDDSIPSPSQVAILNVIRSELKEPWKAIPGSRLEAERLGQLLKTEPLTGEEARSGRLFSDGDAGILHLATHGFYMQITQEESDLHPLRAQERAGVVFAGANHGIRGNDIAASCLLTGADLTSMDLQNVDLVALSACETGIGDAQRGEGVFGLRRALWAAGVQTMVMSQWSVPDSATVELMVKFYEALAFGHSCVESLQGARRALREAGEPIWTWGAFSVYGNPTPIPWLKVCTRSDVCGP
jgi:CHAT domain-containing protein